MLLQLLLRFTAVADACHALPLLACRCRFPAAVMVVLVFWYSYVAVATAAAGAPDAAAAQSQAEHTAANSLHIPDHGHRVPHLRTPSIELLEPGTRSELEE